MAAEQQSQIHVVLNTNYTPGADPGGEGAPGAPPPPLKLKKNTIFWRKIVIFHTKYPKNFRASLPSAQIFYVRLPDLKSWIRPCTPTSMDS